MLFEQWLEGRVRESDPKVDDLFHRRPQWRELAQQLRGSAEDEPPDWAGPASEADRRLVAECFAEARVRGQTAVVARDASPRVSEAPAKKRWPRLLFALAAVFVVSWLAWMWWSADRAPQRKRGVLLGNEAQLDSDQLAKVAPDFSTFDWKEEPLKSRETFALTIWADANGERGRQLTPRIETHDMHMEFSAQQRESWPDVVLWRVDRVDSSGVATPGKLRRAQRSTH
jgi:hypothetical protein